MARVSVGLSPFIIIHYPTAKKDDDYGAAI